MSQPLNRNFRLLWLGQATSVLGDRVHQLAVLWWVLNHSGSPALVGAVMVATSVPVVLVGPFAGAIADRVDRRRLMLTCDLVRMVLVALMAFLAFQGLLTVPLVLALSVLLSAVGALFTPASMAMVPEVVPPEQMLRANSLQELTTQGAGILGPALGGALVAALGAQAAFGLNALTFLVSAIVLLAMRHQPGPMPASGESYWQTLAGGAAILRERPGIASLLASFAIANLFLAPIPVLLPVFAKDVFHAGASGLGMLEGTLGAGMIVAALVLARRGDVSRKVALISGSFVLQGAMMLMMALRPSFYGFGVGLAVLGGALSALNIVVVAAFQRSIPGEQLGRFMGLLTAIVLGVMPLSYALVGVLATRVPPERLLLASGMALALVGLGLLGMPGVRDLERHVIPGSNPS
ncbi:MAG TPA: MFS transporter [Stenomitos sp.]